MYHNESVQNKPSKTAKALYVIAAFGLAFQQLSPALATLNTSTAGGQGTLTVIKHVVDGGAADASDWTMHIQGPTIATFPGDEIGTSTQVSAGTYSVTESSTAWPREYFLFYEGDCDTNGNVTVAAGETKTCILNNVRNTSTIVIHKEDEHGNRMAGVEFTFDGVSYTTDANGEFVIPHTEVGDHIVEETVPDGYHFVSAHGPDCTNENPSTVTLKRTDPTICTFTNARDEERAELTVVKHVEGGNAVAADWMMHVAGPTPLSFPGDENGTSTDVEPGRYAITENGSPEGYVLTYGGDCSPEGTLTVENGESKTCVLTNTFERQPDVCLDPRTIDFDTLPAGTVLTGQYSALGVTFAASNSDTNTLTIFDTAIPTGGDTDLATPGYHPSNTTPLNEVLVIAETTADSNGDSLIDVPNDEGSGGIIHVSFATPTSVNTLQLLDIEEQGGQIRSYASGNSLISTTAIPAPGDNSVQTITINESNVARMEIQLAGSGAVPALEYCEPNTPENGTLIVYKNIDTNADGQVDEFGVTDWTWDIANGSQNIATGTGQSVTPGTYTVSEDMQDGWRVLNLTCEGENRGRVTSGEVTVAEGETVECTFTNQKKVGYILVTKNVDTDGDGQVDEFGVTDWTWDIANGPQDISTGEKQYMPVGEYTVSEDQKDGYEVVNATCENLYGDHAVTDFGATETVHVRVGINDNVACTFTNKKIPAPELNTLSGSKWNDVNGNGTWDNEEPGIADWTIYLWNDDNGKPGAVLDDTTTDQNGDYVFTNLVAGTYWVSEDQPSGWTQTSPDGLGIHGPIELTAGTTSEDNDFGNFKNVDLTVTKLMDADGNVETTNDQTAKENWTVQLWTNDVQVGGDQLTDNNGQYTWSDLGPGTYTVKEVFDANDYEALTDTQMTVTVTSGTNEEVTFINHPLVPELAIEKSVDTDTFLNPGDTVDYTVVVTNIGEATAVNVVLDDTLDEGLTHVQNDAVTRSWELGDLEPGDSVTVTYTVAVGDNTVAGFYDNIAVADADNTDEVSDDETVEVRIPSVLGEESTPELTLDKTVNVDFANPGMLIQYTVTVTNAGDGTAENVILSDALPVGFTFADTGLNTQSWALGDLAPSALVSITYDVRIADTVQAGIYENFATVTADNHDPLTAVAPVEVRQGVVLGIELPRTGGNLPALLLALAALTGLSLAAMAARHFSAPRNKQGGIPVIHS